MCSISDELVNSVNYVSSSSCWHLSVSGDNGDLCLDQSVVKLQRLLWLYNSILERQTLLQPLQVKDESGERGMDVLLCFREYLFSSHTSTCFWSLLCMPVVSMSLGCLLLSSSSTVLLIKHLFHNAFHRYMYLCSQWNMFCTGLM